MDYTASAKKNRPKPKGCGQVMAMATQLAGKAACLAVLIAASCSHRCRSQPADSIWYDEEKPVRLASLVDGWMLYEGLGDKVGAPMEAFAKAVAVRGPDLRILPRSSSLRGHVRIRSRAQALELVRLFTAPETRYLFEDSAFLELTRAAGEEQSVGELDRKTWDSLALRDPVVRDAERGFSVERFVVDEEGTTVYRVVEVVGRDGAYRVQTRAVVARGVHVPVPHYW